MAWHFARPSGRGVSTVGAATELHTRRKRIFIADHTPLCPQGTEKPSTKRGPGALAGRAGTTGGPAARERVLQGAGWLGQDHQLAHIPG